MVGRASDRRREVRSQMMSETRSHSCRIEETRYSLELQGGQVEEELASLVQKQREVLGKLAELDQKV